MFMPRALHRIAAALLLWCMAITVITVPVQTAVTFGTSLKGQGFYCGHEQTVFQRPCTAAEAPCTMQHYWSGGFFPEYGASLLRYYVDGEATASVVLPLGLAHGMAADMDDNAPWNAGGIMGKTGVGYPGWGASPGAGAGRPASASAATQNVTGAGGSGLFNNFQIPFGSNISVTVEMVGEKGHLVIFWLVLRGRTKADALHLPGTPSVPLPRTARLRTHYSANVTLQPLQQLTLYNTTAANGAVLMVTVAVDSAPSNLYPAYHYLEGCMRAFTPAGEQRYRISSGTEDYFLGTFYFNKGQYFFPQAGVTSLCPPTAVGNPASIDCTAAVDNSSKFAAYRLHTGGDPLLFEGGAVQTWRNGDARGCPWPSPSDKPEGDPGVVQASSLALVYEW